MEDESCYLYLERVEGGPVDRRAEKSEEMVRRDNKIKRECVMNSRI